LRSAVAYGFIRATVYETAAVTRTNGPNAYREFGHRAALVHGCHPTENCGIFATEDFSQAWVIVESKFLATQTRNNNLEACLDGYLDVSSSLWINVGKTTFPDVCLLPMWLARVKLETAAMTKHFALKRKFFDGAHHYAGTVFNFPHKILQEERDQKVDEVRIDGFSQRLTPLEIMSHSED
jgi:hypothetical protein